MSNVIRMITIQLDSDSASFIMDLVNDWTSKLKIEDQFAATLVADKSAAIINAIKDGIDERTSEQDRQKASLQKPKQKRQQLKGRGYAGVEHLQGKPSWYPYAFLLLGYGYSSEVVSDILQTADAPPNRVNKIIANFKHSLLENIKMVGPAQRWPLVQEYFGISDPVDDRIAQAILALGDKVTFGPRGVE